MTEVTRSPGLHLGKRRPDSDCEIEVDTPDQVTKRFRVTTASSRSGLEGLRHGDENSLHAFKRNKSGSLSGQELNSIPSAAMSQYEQHEQYHQSVIASMKVEHQMALARKDQEIQRQQQETANLMARCQAMTQEHNAVLEENRVLKRAVAIQDTRYRELSSTHEQLQHVMGLAAEHIAKLEQANRDLTSLVNSCQYGGGGGFHQGPPDVY